MTLSELKSRLAARFRPLTAADIDASVAVILGAIAASMITGNRAEMRGFGTFGVTLRPPRMARNPRTGASVSVPARGAPCFKAIGQLRDRVNRNAALNTGEAP